MNTFKVDDERHNEGDEHDNKGKEGAERSTEIGTAAKTIKKSNSQSKEGETSSDKVHGKDSCEEPVMTGKTVNVGKTRGLTYKKKRGDRLEYASLGNRSSCYVKGRRLLCSRVHLLQGKAATGLLHSVIVPLPSPTQ